MYTMDAFSRHNPDPDQAEDARNAAKWAEFYDLSTEKCAECDGTGIERDEPAPGRLLGHPYSCWCCGGRGRIVDADDLRQWCSRWECDEEGGARR